MYPMALMCVENLAKNENNHFYCRYRADLGQTVAVPLIYTINLVKRPRLSGMGGVGWWREPGPQCPRPMPRF